MANIVHSWDEGGTNIYGFYLESVVETEYQSGGEQSLNANIHHQKYQFQTFLNNWRFIEGLTIISEGFGYLPLILKRAFLMVFV